MENNQKKQYFVESNDRNKYRIYFTKRIHNIFDWFLMQADV